MEDYTWGSSGPHIRKLQVALEGCGLALPKGGVDGILGNETWTKIEAVAGVDELRTNKPLPQAIVDLVLTRGSGNSAPIDLVKPTGLVRVQGDPGDVHGIRQWRDITDIVLHQTGTWMTDKPDRFRTMNAHIGILANHETPIVQVQDLRAYMHHANSANRFSVGIEINGLFPGLAREFDPKVHTAPGPTPSQIANARLAVTYVCDTVSHHGGKVRYIIPHRCVSSTRRSDPGELAWKGVGVWSMRNTSVGGRPYGWTRGTGRPVPREWDSSSTHPY